MTPDVINAYFTPLDYFWYLLVIFVGMVVYYQWKWARTCERNVLILYALKGGGGSFRLAPKDGGEVTIVDESTDSTRTWPINELSTIDVEYPSVGFVPKFLQKTIRMAIVNEGDWEPMLNRSPHRRKVASPDVVAFLTKVGEQGSADVQEEVEEFLKDVSTGPTREMIADPAVLGNLRKSSVLKALATVSSDFTDAMKNLTNRLNRLAAPNPTVVYMGLGLLLVLVAFTVYQVFPLATSVSDMTEAIKTINKSLGLP